MTTKKREILALLSELCEMSPDIRVGQLWSHLGFLGEDQTGRTLWDIEDDQLLEVLYHHRSELRDRSPATSVADKSTDDYPVVKT